MIRLLLYAAIIWVSSATLHETRIRDTLMEKIPQTFVKWAESQGIFVEAEGIVSIARRDTRCIQTQLDIEVKTEVVCDDCETNCVFGEELLNLTKVAVATEHMLIHQFSTTDTVREFLSANSEMLDLVPYHAELASDNKKVSFSPGCPDLASSVNTMSRRRRKRFLGALILGLVTLISLASAAVAIYDAVRVDDNTHAIRGNHAAMSNTLDSTNDVFEDLKQIVEMQGKEIRDLSKNVDAIKFFLTKEGRKLTSRGRDIKAALKLAVFQNKLSPALISPNSLLQAVRRVLRGDEFSTELAFYEANPVSLMKSAKFYATEIDNDSYSLKGLLCFPKVLPKTTFLAMRAVHQGAFDPLKVHFLRPHLANRFLVSMEDLERPLNDFASVIRYWEPSESCNINSAVALSICEPKHITTIPENGRCAIPPAKPCQWERLNVVGPFVRVAYVRGQAIVSTNQVSYDIMSNADNKVLRKNVPITSATFVIKMLPGQHVKVGGTKIYGQLSLSAPLHIVSTITTEDIHAAVAGSRPSLVQAKLEKLKGGWVYNLLGLADEGGGFLGDGLDAVEVVLGDGADGPAPVHRPDLDLRPHRPVDLAAHEPVPSPRVPHRARVVLHPSSSSGDGGRERDLLEEGVGE